MQALRGVFGMAPSGGAAAPKKPNAVLARKKQAAQERPHHERLALSVKAQQLQIGQLQEEVDDLNDKIKLSVDANDRASAGAHLLERKRIQTDIEMRKKKLANTRGQLHQIEMANANIEQALLTREGADELNSAVEAMETIDLDGAVDDMQDAAKTVDEHNERLTESIFGSPDPSEVDSELDAIMGTRMPDAPTTTPVVPTRVPAAAAAKKQESTPIKLRQPK
jgi:hypothetical protein